MPTAVTKGNTQYYIWMVVGFFFMFVFGRVVPPFAGIDQVGVSVIGIFIGTLLIIIVTNETFWPSVVGIFALLICNFAGAGDLLKAWFGNSTIQQIIWVMALTGAVTESGAVNVLSRKMLANKRLQGHPLKLVITLFMAMLVASALVSSPTTMLLLFYPMLDGICEMCGVEKDSELKRTLLLGVYISAMGAYVLPFKGVHLSSIAIINGIMQSAGLTFNNGIYLFLATLVVLVFVSGYIFFMVKVWKIDLSPLKSFDMKKLNLTEADLKMTFRQKVLLGFMLFGIAFLLVSIVLPAGSPVVGFINMIGSTWIWIILFGILCMMRTKEGEPYINGVALLKSRTMWGIVAVAGCFTILGGAIASADYGIQPAISAALAPVLGTASWPIMIILCVVVSAVFTNFTNGMPVSFTINAVCIPLACTMETAGTGNATVLAVATILSAMAAWLTYGAIAYAPILLDREELKAKPSFIWKKGSVTLAIFIVVTCVLCIVFGYIF